MPPAINSPSVANDFYAWRDHLRLHGYLKSRRRGRPARTVGVDGAAQQQSAVDVPAPQENALTGTRRRIREPQQKVGQQRLDLDCFREALRHFEEDQHRSSALYATSTPHRFFSCSDLRLIYGPSNELTEEYLTS
ncbi:hypothetical protein, partial [Sinorhizobium meliloti]|uniref:hypothetical protein n=1 Tax=Rhizobium meliloti TaxID=382 RepID=UPI001AECF27C